MTERQIDRQRYWIAYFFDDLPVSAQFETGALHITIATWFVLDIGENELLKSFASKFTGLNSFEVKVGEPAKFGPQKVVLVSLLKPHKQLADLHERALSMMAETKARWAVKDPHSGPDYMPHIRYREGSELVTGEIVQIGSLSLIKARRREDGERTVAAKVVFNE